MYEFFQGLFQYGLNSLHTLFVWIGSLIESFFGALKTVLITLFQPIIAFFLGIAYLLAKCFHIAVLVVQVIFGLFKVVFGVILGIFNTFAQLLGFSGSTDYYYLPNAYQHGWNAVTEMLSSTGVHTIAILMTVFVWLITAYAVIRIAGGDR
ncbi:MAG: hypothetical protein GXY50_02375 [Syntrophomonadaceae bacterium]|nr:hypothetical protein [Syntrophomonadaceae bacterium]